ncbi:MAG: Rubrerythrin [Candidatus Tokpelaia sp. JSC085]|nr:MAG: Rubrerythrin [Candidatus Tokpelaia sp. JSC085]
MLSSLFFSGRRPFSSLSEQEILALAISSEEDDERIYLNYAEGLRENFPDTATIFEKMAGEESQHRQRLIAIFRNRFGEHIPLIRREHVRGFYERKPDWLMRPLGIDRVRQAVFQMEEQTANFYHTAAKSATDAETRKLLGDLAMEEEKHEYIADVLEKKYAPGNVQEKERERERKQNLLTWIQPGLAGLMDGSVSTLAPIFAAAFATSDTRKTFLIGLSASLGAGMSMGLTEAFHDDGKLSGRGSSTKRGIANGLMTTIGGIGHTLPYLIPDFNIATTISCIVVAIELWSIAFIQNRYMDTPFFRAALQIVLGGVLVFTIGILVGHF